MIANFHGLNLSNIWEHQFTVSSSTFISGWPNSAKMRATWNSNQKVKWSSIWEILIRFWWDGCRWKELFQGYTTTPSSSKSDQYFLCRRPPNFEVIILCCSHFWPFIHPNYFCGRTHRKLMLSYILIYMEPIQIQCILNASIKYSVQKRCILNAPERRIKM